jgi:hypothetical protein
MSDYDKWAMELQVKLHRTLVHYLIEIHEREVAALILDGQVVLQSDNYRCYIDVPPSAYPLLEASEEIKSVLISAMCTVARGYLQDQNGNDVERICVEFRMQLLPVDENWKEIARKLILNAKGTNQGLISELCAAKNGRPIQAWNELRYASASEVRIAQELEKRKLLFFPLPVAVRAETGKNYLDHREVDFLVCHNGAWGILEVAYHPDRYEKDSEKDYWFTKAGILCIRHYTAERCYNEPSRVVDEFLAVLRQHEK